MRTDYELTINYPPEDGEWIDTELDAEITNAAGVEYATGSGAGLLTGGRDLNFSFTSRVEAEAALERIKELGLQKYRWTIERWEHDDNDEITDHRTLVMGVSPAMKEVEA